MLAYLIGDLGVWTGAFLIVAVVAIGGVGSILLSRKRASDYEIDKMKMQNERDIALANTSANREVNMAKVQQNLITSHRSEDS